MQDTNMKISVVTPTFNQAHFIERTIDSLINQKWDFEIEYIIMDWGSTDNTVKVLKKYDKVLKDKKYKHITFIRKSEKDKGQSDAINKGLKVASWDILTYLNSDDTYEPGALKRVVKALSSGKYQRSYGKCKIIDEHDKEIRKPITAYKNMLLKNWSYWKLLTENFISQMTVFWTKEAMEKVGLFNEKEHLCMDYDYRLKLGRYFKPTVIPHYIANFRFYQTSKSGSYFFQQFKDQLRLAKKYADGKYPIRIFIHSILYWRTIILYKLFHWIRW